jgi:hypothetical protein
MKSKRGGANNNSNSSSNSSGGNFNMVIIIIIAIVVLGVAVYYGYKYLNSYEASSSKTKTFIPYIHDAKDAKRFTNGSIPKSTQGNEYNYNLWVYVADYNHRNEDDKCILYKGEVGNTVFNNADNVEENLNNRGNPSMWLLKKRNTLRIQIALETRYASMDSCTIEGFQGNGNQILNSNTLSNIISVNNTNGNVANTTNSNVANTTNSNVANNANSNSNFIKPKICDIEHFPLQRWVCVNLALSDNILDISLNGELVKSCMLPGAAMLNNSDLLVCPSGGFNGFIANLNVSDKALGPSEIKSIYRKGPTLKPGLLG